MDKTKEQKATVEEFIKVLQEFLRENVVGVVERKDDASFFFYLAGGQKFCVSAKEE